MSDETIYQDFPDEAPPAHIAHAIQVLNEVLAVEPAALATLLRTRVTLNSDMLDDHSSVQTGEDLFTGRSWLSGMGLVNGLFGADEHGIGYIYIETPSPDDLATITAFGYLPASKRKLFRVMGKGD